MIRAPGRTLQAQLLYLWVLVRRFKLTFFSLVLLVFGGGTMMCTCTRASDSPIGRLMVVAELQVDGCSKGQTVADLRDQSGTLVMHLLHADRSVRFDPPGAVRLGRGDRVTVQAGLPGYQALRREDGARGVTPGEILVGNARAVRPGQRARHRAGPRPRGAAQGDALAARHRGARRVRRRHRRALGRFVPRERGAERAPLRGHARRGGALRAGGGRGLHRAVARIAGSTRRCARSTPRARTRRRASTSTGCCATSAARAWTRDDDTRARIRTLNDELVAHRAGVQPQTSATTCAFVDLEPGELEGLPADYLRARPARPDGRCASPPILPITSRS